MDEESSDKLVSLMNQVFSNLDILEVILLNLPTTSVNDILPFRLVAKLWHKASFKVLLQLPRSPLETVNTTSLDDPSQAGLLDIISPQCNLPIQASIRNLVLKPDQLNFLKVYSKNLVAVQLNIPEKKEPFPTEPYALNLPNLKIVQVRMEAMKKLYYSEDSSAFKLVKMFLQSNKRSKSFQVVHFAPVIDDFSSEIPSTVTSLKLENCCWANKIENSILNAHLPNLQVLDIHVVELARGAYGVELDEIIQKFSSSLVRLDITVRDYVIRRTVHVYFGSIMERLTNLSMRGLLLRVPPVPWSELLPELKTVRLRDNAYPSTSENFRALTCNGPDGLLKMNYLSIKASRSWAFKRAGPAEHLFKPFRTLKRLILSDLHDPDIYSLLPGVFTNLTLLEDLEMTVLSNTNQSVEELLIGMKPEDIPEDESLWNDILERNLRSIINLKRLRRLKVQVSDSDENGPTLFNISAFVFTALIMIPDLTHIEIIGEQIQVHEELKQKWINSNRHIILKPYDYSSQMGSMSEKRKHDMFYDVYEYDDEQI